MTQESQTNSQNDGTHEMHFPKIEIIRQKAETNRWFFWDAVKKFTTNPESLEIKVFEWNTFLNEAIVYQNIAIDNIKQKLAPESYKIFKKSLLFKKLRLNMFYIQNYLKNSNIQNVPIYSKHILEAMASVFGQISYLINLSVDDEMLSHFLKSSELSYKSNQRLRRFKKVTFNDGCKVLIYTL